MYEGEFDMYLFYENPIAYFQGVKISPKMYITGFKKKAVFASRNIGNSDDL